MSELITSRAGAPDLGGGPVHVNEAPTRPLALITEQEVKFSTAVAGTSLRTKPAYRALAALHAILRRTPSDARPVRRHYPPRRRNYVENAAMAREMYRL